MPEKEELQQKILRHQLIQNRVKALSDRRSFLLSKMLEIQTTLDSMREVGGKKDMLLTLGSGVFVPAILKGTRNVIVELGANVAVKKNVSEAKDVLEKRKKSLEDAMKSTEEEMVKLNKELVELEPQIRGLLEKSQTIPRKRR